jgi:hypothetical protein
MYESPKRDPSVCHHCRHPFEPGQRRFIIKDEASWSWETVPICGLCWKLELNDGWKRFDQNCYGCDEPIFTPTGRGWMGVCSSRCYQRANRQWRRWPVRCKVCKKSFTPVRKDASTCSNACRQRAYRRRVSTRTGVDGNDAARRST